MLGDEVLGTYGIVMVWAAFLAPLSHLGLNNLVQKMATSTNDVEQSRRYLQTAVWLRLAAGGFFAALMIAGFMLFYPHYFSQGPWQIATLFVLQSFTAMIVYEYDQNYRGHFRAVAIAKVVISLITLIARIILLIRGANIDMLLLIVGIEFFLTGLLQYYWARRYAPDEPALQWRYFDWVAGKEMLRRSSWLWTSAIVSVIYLKIDSNHDREYDWHRSDWPIYCGRKDIRAVVRHSSNPGGTLLSRLAQNLHAQLVGIFTNATQALRPLFCYGRGNFDSDDYLCQMDHVICLW